MKTFCCTLLLLCVLTANAAAQQTIFIVRHAERADTSSGGGMMAADPDLSAAGAARAESLASMLKDANVTAIFTTEFKRTQQTAAPLAKALGLQIVTIGSGEQPKLIQAVKNTAGNVLVVGHSNTVPAILKDLGISTAITIADSEFDNLFIVTAGPSPRLLRLHFR